MHRRGTLPILQSNRATHRLRPTLAAATSRPFPSNPESLPADTMSLLVHIGAPKTGTTFLQTQIFARTDGLGCIGRPHQDTADYRRFAHALMQEEDESTAIATIRSYLHRAVEEEKARPFVLSDEAISFAPLWHVVARRLAAVAPEAKILLTVRSQFSAITSFYANHGRLLRNVPAPYRGRHISFADWLEFAIRKVENSYEKNYLRVLFYDRLTDVFDNFFDRANVTVLLYEAMQTRREDFAAQLSSALQADCAASFLAARDTRANPRHSERQLAFNALQSKFPLMRRAARRLAFTSGVRTAVRRYIEGGQPVQTELNDAQRRLVADLYRESNQRLIEKYNLALNDFDYPL